MKEIYQERLDKAAETLIDYVKACKVKECEYSKKKFDRLLECFNSCLFEYINNVAIITYKNNNIVSLVSLYDEEIRTQVADDSVIKLQKVLPGLIKMKSAERCKYISRVTTNAMKDYKKHALIWLKHNTLIIDDTFEDGTPKMQFADDSDIDDDVLMRKYMSDVLQYSSQNLSALDIIAVFSKDVHYPTKKVAEDLKKHGEYKVLKSVLEELFKKYQYIKEDEFLNVLEYSKNTNRTFSKTPTVIAHDLSNRKMLSKRKIIIAFPHIKEELAEKSEEAPSRS